MKPLSIYIHIPFCIKKCYYCDFLSAPADNLVQEEYLRALREEIFTAAKKYSDYTVQTIFIGGGTPTAIKAEDICDLLHVINTSFSIAEDAEISIESNPGTVTKQALILYKKAGINRLSIGLQSAQDKELKLLGRIHDYKYFLKTYSMAVEAGFTNINIDLMSALPGQKAVDYKETLKKVMALSPRPSHISAYSLIIEEGTAFYDLYAEERDAMAHTGEKQAHLPSEEEERQMYLLTNQILQDVGYHRYEISNYSLPGYECRHNKVYWQRGDYVGFGLGASSLVENNRFENIKDLQLYINNNDKISKSVPLSKKEQMEEFMFLGLRLTQGVEKEEFSKNFGVSMEEIYGNVIRKNIQAELMMDGTFEYLTKNGLDLSNYVMSQFLLD